MGWPRHGVKIAAFFGAINDVPLRASRAVGSEEDPRSAIRDARRLLRITLFLDGYAGYLTYKPKCHLDEI